MKTILHIIYSLGRGGAETMLVGALPHLKEYKNVVVIFSPVNHFEQELQCNELICLHTRSLLTLPLSVIKLKKIIKDIKPDLIHSHLPQSNFAARLAAPPSVPLVTTIHTAISAAVDYKKWYIKWLDRYTYNSRRSTIIGVSQQALNDYFSVLNIKPGKATVIYTYANVSPSVTTIEQKPAGKIALITVGSLRKNKNFHYLIEAFGYLKNENIFVDIYGNGDEYDNLKSQIENAGVKVDLKGQVNNIPALMGGYDIFTMPSKFEGFSVSVLEAMAQKRPLLLSDIPSFREQCLDAAVYFDLQNPKDFADKLKAMIADRQQMDKLGLMGYNRMIHNFTPEHYLKKLKEVYEAEMKQP